MGMGRGQHARLAVAGLDAVHEVAWSPDLVNCPFTADTAQNNEIKLQNLPHLASISTSRSTHSCRICCTSRPSPPLSPASAESAAATVRASMSCRGGQRRRLVPCMRRPAVE